MTKALSPGVLTSVRWFQLKWADGFRKGDNANMELTSCRKLLSVDDLSCKLVACTLLHTSSHHGEGSSVKGKSNYSHLVK